MNRVLLIGRLTADPRSDYTANGLARTTFQLAVDRRFRKQGERQADFIPVTCWGKLAEVAGHHLSKGRRVGVEGSLRVDRVIHGNGERTYVAVVADEIEFLDAPRAGGGRAAPPEGAEGEDDDWGDE